MYISVELKLDARASVEELGILCLSSAPSSCRREVFPRGLGCVYDNAQRFIHGCADGRLGKAGNFRDVPVDAWTHVSVKSSLLFVKMRWGRPCCGWLFCWGSWEGERKHQVLSG